MFFTIAIQAGTLPKPKKGMLALCGLFCYLIYHINIFLTDRAENTRPSELN